MKYTTKIFIEKANLIHNNKYDYSKVNYSNAHTKIEIICKDHGIFLQKPYSHLQGSGCVECAGLKKLTTKIFIERSKKIHGNKYNYSKVNYINSQTKVCIICPTHGEFWQIANEHLQRKGCINCAGLKKLTVKEFIEKASLIHNNKYDYSKIDYVNNHTKIYIKCLTHGEFWQRPYSHLQGSGCPTCANKNKGSYKKSNTKIFIEKANLIHNNRYDYSEVDYLNSYTKVCIICPEHGKFWQKPNKHNTSKQGCPMCNRSIGEELIAKILNSKNINFEVQKTFNDCKNINILQFDFYLPEQNLLIEYDGEQHYKPLKHFGGKSGFIYRKYNDKIKNSYCKDNSINLLRIPYWENNVENIIHKRF